MKQMIYKNAKEQKILYIGMFYDRAFVIMSMGTHPTAYIIVPELKDMNYDEVNEKYDLPVEITYSNNKLITEDFTINNTWVIGWDYAHAGDQVGLFSKGHKYTTEEIFDDVIRVIKQLNKQLEKGDINE